MRSTLWPVPWRYSRFMKYPLSQLSPSIESMGWIHLERTISKYNSRRMSELRKRDERNSKSSTNISHNLVIRIETYIVWLNSYSFSDFGWWFWTPWLSMIRSMIQRMTVNLYFYHKCVTSKRQMKLNDGQSRTTKYYPLVHTDYQFLDGNVLSYRLSTRILVRIEVLLFIYCSCRQNFVLYI